MMQTPRLGSVLARAISWPTALSTFAGVLGAGLMDALLTILRGTAGAVGVVALALALYGALGLLVGLLAGWIVATLRNVLPDGWRAQPQTDAHATVALGAFVVGALVLATLSAFGYAAFTAGMARRTLGTLATFGVTALAAPFAAVAALAARGPLARLAVRLPAPRALGRAGLLAVVLLAVGVLAALLALSRADWRVLDLKPLLAVLFAAFLGLAHGLFWYVTEDGRALHVRLPRGAIRTATVAVVVLAWPFAARLPEGAPAYEAVAERSLGLRLGLRLARALADGDGDGYARWFGGGDCDDRRADTYPGADDVPDDGIDQNCAAGDAHAEATGPTIEPEAAAPAAPPAANASHLNLLIVSIDALRADRLGITGYRRRGRSLTPNLDRLAARGVSFRRVWAQAPNTPRSFPSLLTSRYPSAIAWQQRSLNYSPILPSNDTFFERLAGAGWTPVGVFSHFYFTSDRGLSQGFREWSNDGAGTIAESNHDIAAPRIVPRAIARLRAAAASQQRFALWTHLFEPHSSYMAHPEFPTSLSGVQGLEEKYDYEIAFADAWVGKLLAAVDQLGLTDKTLIVVHADHGEAWGEHRLYFHGQDLTEEQLRVPLIIAAPGLPPGKVDEPVALIDVGPTVLDLLGVSPSPRFLGRSLKPLLTGQELPARPVFAELLPATAWPKHETCIVDGNWKLVHKLSDRRYELYDLRSDPGGQRDRSKEGGEAQQQLARLQARLLQFEERHE